MPAIEADELATKAESAFLVAARKVIDDARRAGDGVLIWRDGRVTEISCDEAERLLALAAQQSQAERTDAGVGRQ